LKLYQEKSQITIAGQTIPSVLLKQRTEKCPKMPLYLIVKPSWGKADFFVTMLQEPFKVKSLI